MSSVLENVLTHVVTLTQVGTSVYLRETHPGTPFKFLLGSQSFYLGQLMTIYRDVTMKNSADQVLQGRPVQVDKIMFEPGCSSKINKYISKTDPTGRIARLVLVIYQPWILYISTLINYLNLPDEFPFGTRYKVKQLNQENR